MTTVFFFLYEFLNSPDLWRNVLWVWCKLSLL